MGLSSYGGGIRRSVHGYPPDVVRLRRKYGLPVTAAEAAVYTAQTYTKPVITPGEKAAIVLSLNPRARWLLRQVAR